MKKMIFMVLLLCVFGCATFQTPEIGPDIDSAEVDWSKMRAYNLSKPYVVSLLRYPYDATFPPFREISVSWEGGHYYHVSAYVMAANALGDRKKIYYECVLSAFPEGEWRFVEIEIKYKNDPASRFWGWH